MKWQKLGHIFNFSSSPFKKRFVSHAQSPQAVVLNDRIRIYFSTRKLDDNKKFLSYVQYVDFDLDFKRIIDYSKREVVSLGKIGCFDEHGIFPLSPVQVGKKIYGYTNGLSRRQSVDLESSIGFAISDDNGKTFKKLGDGPLLSASLDEPFLVGDAFVRQFDRKFHMFYLFGKKWGNHTSSHESERLYKIAHAVSDDGLSWSRDSKFIISDKIGENECQALPTVIKIGNIYHMYFCYRHMVGFRDQARRGYRLGYAYSKDLVNWTRNDSSAGIGLSATGWDSEMMCYPNVFACLGNIYLLYNGNHFGKEGFGVARLEKAL